MNMKTSFKTERNEYQDWNNDWVLCTINEEILTIRHIIQNFRSQEEKRNIYKSFQTVRKGSGINMALDFLIATQEVRSKWNNVLWRKKKILNYNTIYIKTINQGIIRHVSSWKASLPHAFYQEVNGEWDQPKLGRK